MKRFLAFMFGLIFGVVFLLGTFGIALYSSVTVVHPNEIYADMEKYLGDLGDVSLLQAYYTILDLYHDKTGNLTNQKLYSIGDFLADNHISSTNEQGQTVAFGVVMPKELLDAPLFEYFNTNVDSNGHTGVQRALKQIKLSAVPSIVNTFSTTDANGNTIISQDVVAKLDEHSVFDLVYGESKSLNGVPQIVANLAVILEDIVLADFVPALRPTTETDNLIKNLLWAVGKAPIGQLIVDITGDENLLGMLNDDGALAEVGNLTFTDILGDSDPMINSLLGNVSIADLVNEQGDLAVLDALECVSLAGLVGAVKRPADVQIAISNITSYFETKQDGSRGPLIWSVGALDGKYYISLNAENDAVKTTWMEGQLLCDNSHDTHVASCFDYLWYAPCKVQHQHADEYTLKVNGENTPHAPVDTTSLHYTLAKLNLGYLFDDTGAINIDNFVAQFDHHSLATIIDQLLADNDIFSKLSDLLQLDEMNLSELLADGGIDKLVSNLMDKPIADILDTFGVTGMDAIVDIVGHMSINQLMQGGYEDIVIGDLLGLVRQDLTNDIYQADGQLASGVVIREFTATVDGQTVVQLCVAQKVDGPNTQYYLSKDALTWYEGKLNCEDGAHTNFDSHDKQCFEYLLYQKCANEDISHNHAQEDAFCSADGNTYYVEANQLFHILGNKTVGDIIHDGFDNLLEELKEIQLAELFDLLGMDNLDGALKKLSEFTIKELMEGGYNKLTLGDLLGYKRYQNDGAINSGSIVEIVDSEDNTLGFVAMAGEQMVKSTDGQSWYNAKLACSKEHDHTFSCYEYLWYLACPDDCVEEHNHLFIEGREHTLVTGVYSVIVDITIEKLTNDPNHLVDKLMDVKLETLIGDDSEGLMATLGQYSINDLMDPDTINNIGLAEVLNYIRCDITQSVTLANGWNVDLVVEGGATIVKYNSTTNNYAYFDVEASKWYKAQMHCKKEEHTHSAPDCGTVDDWTCEKKQHIHDIDCYSYAWYAECTNVNCDDHKEHFTLEDKTYGSVSGIYGVFADLSIGDITQGTDLMETITNRLTLGDIFGDNIPEMLETLRDTPVADLESELQTIKVGNLLGYTYNDTLQRWEKEVDGVMQPLEKVEKIIADKTIDDLKDFNSILDEIHLGDVLDPVPDMLKKLTDTPITQIGEEIDKLVVGDFLGYGHLSVDVTTGNWNAVVGMEGLYEHTDGRFALLSTDGIHYIAETHCQLEVHSHTAPECGTEEPWTCEIEEHEHSIDCYRLKWYIKCEDECDGSSHEGDLHFVDMDGNNHTEVVGISSKLADKTINELSDLDDLMNELTLNDVFGEGKVPNMLESIADEKVANLESALNTIYVGDFLAYEQGERLLVCEQTDALHIHNEDLGDANCCYERKLACNDKSHVHSAMCYIYCYEWWQLVCEENHNHSLGSTPECYEKVSGITGKIANERLDTLSDIGETIKTFTLHDVLGDDVPDMLKSIQYEPISNLNDSINSIYLGEFLGYTMGERLLECDITDPLHLHNEDLGSEDCCYNRQLDCSDKVHVHSAMCYYYGYNWWQLDCEENHQHISTCYQQVDGMMAKIANKKVGNLASVSEDIKTYTFAEIMGKNDEDNAIIKELYNTPVGEMGSKMDTIMLGTAMGYYRKVLCALDHEHSDGCYEVENGKVVWYTDEKCTIKVIAPQSAFVNSTLDGVAEDISNIKLGELIEVDENSSSMLKALTDTPIDGIADAIDQMALGTSMGFVRNPVDQNSYTVDIFVKLGHVVIKSDGANYTKLYNENWYEAVLTCEEEHVLPEVHTDECYGFVWYEKCQVEEHVHTQPDCGLTGAWTCDKQEHSHTTDFIIDGEKHQKVNGLNAKMSNLTIGDMDGKVVVDIVMGLSMKDMMDSDILNFTEEDKFKLSILFGCRNKTHTVGLFEYNMEGFFAYNASLVPDGTSVDAEEYFRLTHGIGAEDTLTQHQLAHRDLWQDCTLTEFIDKLLENF